MHSIIVRRDIEIYFMQSSEFSAGPSYTES